MLVLWIIGILLAVWLWFRLRRHSAERELAKSFNAKPVTKKSFITPKLRQLYSSASAEEVQAAISSGADVNAEDEDGNTPLMCAAERNNDAKVI